VLDLFQLHVHSVIACVCSLPTEHRQKEFNSGDFTFVIDIQKFDKNPLINSVSHITLGGLGTLFGWDKSTKAPRGNGTGYQQTSISTTVLSNHARWDIGHLNALQ